MEVTSELHAPTVLLSGKEFQVPILQLFRQETHLFFFLSETEPQILLLFSTKATRYTDWDFPADWKSFNYQLALSFFSITAAVKTNSEKSMKEFFGLWPSRHVLCRRFCLWYKEEAASDESSQLIFLDILEKLVSIFMQ